jgi:hypothetical protein
VTELIPVLKHPPCAVVGGESGRGNVVKLWLCAVMCVQRLNEMGNIPINV